MEKELDHCPFKGVKNAGVAIDGRIIFTFDCPYAKKNDFEKTKKADKKETSMQNRFRFRVYDKYYKGYMQEGSIDIPKVFDGSSFIVEQCTGLKDKNGTLIYEGDIISATTFDEHNRQFIVKYANEDACFGLFITKSMYMLFNKVYEDSLEVIGNIHQDSHLLEKS